MENILFILKKYLKDIIIVFLLVVSMGLAIYAILRQTNDNVLESDLSLSNESILQEDDDEEQDISEAIINVDIKGAVNNPGVYQVSLGSIVNDVIALAGGFTKDAYQNNLNLSKKVSDEMVIYVYKTKEMTKEDNTSSNVCEVPSYTITQCTENKESIIISENNVNNTSDTTNQNNNSLININTADKTSLMELSGIGEAKAQAIIDYRNNVSEFKKIEDILNVSGIGDSVFAQIKDYITV